MIRPPAGATPAALNTKHRPLPNDLVFPYGTTYGAPLARRSWPPRPVKQCCCRNVIFFTPSI